MTPAWLHLLSIVMLAVGMVSAIAVIVDETRRPQPMWIMYAVWPAVSLFGFAGLYLLAGRRNAQRQSFAAAVAKGTCHCGAGCTLGDICAETLCVIFPTITVALGFGTVFPQKIFAVWIADYILAFIFGIAFQYFTIAPMRHLGMMEGLVQAIKADALSLTAWQIGMYGFMGAAVLWIFPASFGVRLDATMPEFWFMMQIAMVCGFLTSYPMNWWLIRTGIKEKM